MVTAAPSFPCPGRRAATPLVAVVFLAFGFSLLRADEQETFPTLAEALEQAKEDRRLVFLELMAWNCPHCQAFEKKVLTSETFQKFASESLHLVFYDINRQSQLTAAQRTEITELIKEHRVKFTPTILVFSPDGTLLLQTVGYKGTPPEEIVKHLESLAD